MVICYQDFPNICRICLRSVDLHNFELKVMDLFKLITNIEVKENDILPKNVCRMCLSQLQDIDLFIDKCKTNDVLLKKICQGIKVSESEEFDNDGEIDTNSDQDEAISFKSDLVNTALPSEPFVSDTRLNKSLKSNNSYRTNCSNCKEDISKTGLKKHYRLNVKCRPTDCVCPICEKSFYPRYKLAIHLRSHNKNTPYVCPECSKRFAFAENLRRHVLTHKGVKPFVCKVCEKGFLRKRSLDEHMNFHTGKTPYICVYCGKAFKRLTDHAAHIYHKHNVNTDQTPKDKRKYTEKRVHLRLECKTCGKIFASRSGFANHQLIHEGVKKFLCNICGRKFITNPTLLNHMRIHTGEKPFECKECGKSFTQKHSLNVHISSQHVADSVPLSCPNCDKKYHTKTGLNNHLLTHTDEKLLQCPDCNKCFHLKHAFRNHVVTHREEKLHKCNLCDKSFVSVSHLKVHIRTHSGEKPYPCGVCGKQLAQPQTLKVHMRQHTGETPYICCVCDKGFHDSSNLKRHYKRHHGGCKDASKGVIVRNNGCVQGVDGKN